ncbi:hypothetical protein K523DRAFT_359318 [Schizophyllum commune Tattone D]|nr:hypothetical protein K523DRAFT_359318 [Schizophyllum commune Tattone D]
MAEGAHSPRHSNPIRRRIVTQQLEGTWSSQQSTAPSRREAKADHVAMAGKTPRALTVIAAAHAAGAQRLLARAESHFHKCVVSSPTGIVCRMLMRNLRILVSSTMSTSGGARPHSPLGRQQEHVQVGHPRRTKAIHINLHPKLLHELR